MGGEALRRFFFFVFFVALSAGVWADGFSVSAERLGDLWIVKGRLDGRSAMFLVDTGANRSVFAPSKQYPVGERWASLSLGGTLHQLKMVVAESNLLAVLEKRGREQGVEDGLTWAILGVDFLAQYTISFDLAAKTITFSDPTGLSKEDAVDWCRKGKGGSAVEFAIDRFHLGRPVIRVQVGTDVLLALFDTGAETSSFKSLPDHSSFVLGQTRQETHRGTQIISAWVVKDLRIGASAIPLLCVQSGANQGQLDSIPSLFSPWDLSSDRIVLDFVRKKVVFGAPLRDRQLSRFLSEICRFVIDIRGDQILVGTHQKQSLRGLQAFAGVPIEEVAGIKSSDLLQAFERRGPSGELIFKRLFERTRKSFDLACLDAGGKKTVRINVEM